MSLQGLPDFAQPLHTDRGLIFYPYEGVGPFLVVPNQLTIGDRSDGQPDFALTLVRGQSPIFPPKPYGMLDFTLRSESPIEEALQQVRQHDPQAIVKAVTFSSGFLQFYPAVNGETLSTDLKVPIELAWNGLETSRYHLRMTESTAVMLKGALMGQIVQLIARADLEVLGVAPRLPIRVEFDPTILLDRLVALGNGQRRVTDAAIVDYFRQDLATLPLTLRGTIKSPEEFARTMADWIRSHYGQTSANSTLTSTLTDHDLTQIVLALPTMPGVQSWDLSQPQITTRTIVLTLDPLESARQLVQKQGINAIFHETIVPILPMGTLSVTVEANLPTPILGIFSMGVTLTAPPVLPARSQTKIASAEFTKSLETVTLRLPLAPREPPCYTVSTYVILSNVQGDEQLWSDEMPGQGDRLFLQPNQFPVHFITVGADRSLLEQATLQGLCRWTEGNSDRSLPFTLNREQPKVSLALPKTALNSTLECIAKSIDGTQTRSIAPFSARNTEIGLHFFPDFGPQQVQISCELDEHHPVYAIDLQPEGSTEISLLLFTSTEPKKNWQWLVRSPFQSRYRYRPHRDPTQVPAEWSAYQSPSIPLTIKPLGDL
jgi:hypothetical protein